MAFTDSQIQELAMSLRPIDDYLQELEATRRELEEAFGLRLVDLGATVEESVFPPRS